MRTREIKDSLYGQVARIGKAVANPKRLELIELLAQGEKAVEALASELDCEIQLTSAHLQVLKAAHLVEARRVGKQVLHRLASPEVGRLWVTLRQVAEAQLSELREALRGMLAEPASLDPVDRASLMNRARNGEVVVIDVRPEPEYATAHLPFARSMPLQELARRLEELPAGKEVVAYCRGPFCLMADQAVALLSDRGFTVRKWRDGICEWQEAGMPITSMATEREVGL